MDKNVFIANVTENDDFAIQLHRFLGEHGIKCFQYKIDLLPGENITQETENKIKNSDHCIICFSKELNDREKTDMRREIYKAIAETNERKPNSKFIIPVKVNQCEIEDFKINPNNSIRDLWYANFYENSDKAHQDLLKIILGTEQEESIEIIENSIQPEFSSLRRDKQPSIEFHVKQELRETVEQEINKRVELERNQLQEYQSTPEIDISTFHTHLGKVDALERLEIQVKSLNTKGMRLLPKDSRTIGLIDYLDNGNVYLNAVFAEARNIRNNPRGFDGSAASSPDGERGKIEVMVAFMSYIRSIKVN